MLGADQPVVEVQVQVRMWSVWAFWDQRARELGAGTVPGEGFRLMVREEARRGLRGKGDRWGRSSAWSRSFWVALGMAEFGEAVWERSGVGGKVVEIK